jgi:hypothetical protein
MADERPAGLYSCLTGACTVTTEHSKDTSVYLRYEFDSIEEYPNKQSEEEQRAFFTHEPELKNNQMWSQAFWNGIDIALAYRKPNAKVHYIHTSMVDFPESSLLLDPLPFDQKKDGVAAFIGFCESKARNKMVMNLNRVLPIHSFGKCLHTHDLEKVLPTCASYNRLHANRDPVKECTLYNFKFYLAFENSQSQGYITEKLWQALKMVSRYSLILATKQRCYRDQYRSIGEPRM